MLATLSLLVALAVDPSSAECDLCRATAWDKCSHNVTNCTSGTSCISVSSNLTERVVKDNKQTTLTTLSVARGCGDASVCNKELFANFRHTQWRIQTACGQHPVIRPASRQNGKRCFGCIAAPSECTETVDCYDDENLCISAEESVGGNVMVNRGCATESMCGYGHNISEVLGKGLVGRVSCCKGDLCNSSVILGHAPVLQILVLILLFFMPL